MNKFWCFVNGKYCNSICKHLHSNLIFFQLLINFVYISQQNRSDNWIKEKACHPSAWILFFLRWRISDFFWPNVRQNNESDLRYFEIFSVEIIFKINDMSEWNCLTSYSWLGLWTCFICPLKNISNVKKWNHESNGQ